MAAPPEVASASQQTPRPPPHPGNCPRAAAAAALSLQPLELGFSDGNLSLFFQGRGSQAWAPVSRLEQGQPGYLAVAAPLEVKKVLGWGGRWVKGSGHSALARPVLVTQ